jgi:hypothetical protein
LPAVEKWLFSSAGRNRAGDERYTVGEEPGRVDDCGEEDGSRKKGSNLKGGGERHRRDGTARSMAATSGVGADAV